MEEEILQSVLAVGEEENGQKALEILYMSAYFEPTKSMHLDMFFYVFDDINEESAAAIQLLQKKSLIELNNEKIFFIKKDVQREVRKYLRQVGKQEDILTNAIYVQIFHIFSICNSFYIIPNCIDHALSLLSYVRESDELVEISLGLPNLVVMALRLHNRLKEAHAFGKKALKFLVNIVGECHTATLSLQHTLAVVLTDRGQHAKAAKVLQDLAEKDVKYSTKEAITKTLIVHARDLCELSKYTEALPLYQTIFAGKTVLDTFDSETLTAWNDYAVLLYEIGCYSDAIYILLDVLSQRKKGLVPHDPYGLKTRLSLAAVFQAQGKYNQAMKHLKEAFHEFKKHLGEYHQDTLRSERDIGTLLLHRGDHKEALRTLKDVEIKFLKIFHESHPDILCTRANIVGALMNLNEYDEALQISEDVYEAYKIIFGEKQNETLRVKYNIGAIFLKQGKLNEGIKILREVYLGFYDVFGPENILTLNLETVLELLGCLPSILHEASKKGDINKVVSLIQNGEDVNKADFDGRIPLHFAALNGHINIARYLLKRGAMHNAKDFRRATPYQLASDEQMKDLLNSVNNLFKDVKKGIENNIASHEELINARDKNGYSLLHWAVCNSHKLVVRQLLAAGADPKYTCLKGNTPLHVASTKGHKEIADILLSSVTGNDLRCLVNFKTAEKGNTALHVAAKNNNIGIVKCVLMHGAICDIQNKEGLTPVELSSLQSILDLLNMTKAVFFSVKAGNPDTISQLKLLNNEELAAIMEARNSQGHTLLQVAIMYQHKNIMHKLLQLIQDIDYSK